jgi:GDP-4-dehydro-6-deoxy-D-mannose reductase
MKCFVTGACGFIGRYLIQHLLAAGHQVWASDLESCALCEQRRQGLVFVRLDLLASELGPPLVACQPDWIFHLAAQSLPNRSWEVPQLTFEVNVGGTLRLLEAVRRVAPKARVLVVTSSAVYAPRAVPEPIREDAPLNPVTPYGISKLAQDHVARLYAQRYALAVVRARPLYLIGPGKIGDVCSDFARGIVAVERGAAQDLRVGNLEVVRDFLDVRDGVTALSAVVERGAPGEVYNISSGCGYRVGDILERFRQLALVPVKVSLDASRIRPLDELVKIADNSRLRALGWQPRMELEQTLQDILKYWRLAQAS